MGNMLLFQMTSYLEQDNENTDLCVVCFSITARSESKRLLEQLLSEPVPHQLLMQYVTLTTMNGHHELPVSRLYLLIADIKQDYVILEKMLTNSSKIAVLLAKMIRHDGNDR